MLNTYRFSANNQIRFPVVSPLLAAAVERAGDGEISSLYLSTAPNIAPADAECALLGGVVGVVECDAKAPQCATHARHSGTHTIN